MDFINYLINYIKRVIPIEVLDLAVTDRRSSSIVNLSLESKIEHKLLRPAFLLDMQLITGLEMVIPIANLPFNNDIDGVTVLKIGDNILQGRRLINALSLANARETRGVSASNSTDAFSQVMSNNNSWSNASVDARLEVISPNEILVYSNIGAIAQLAIRVTVELSDNFAEINSKSYPQLAHVALMSVKMLIRTELIVKLGMSQLYHGHELSIMESIISEYDGAYDEYYENMYLLKKTVFMNDNVSMARYVQNLIPNNL